MGGESTGRQSWTVVRPALPMNKRKKINTMLPGGYYGPGSMLNALHIFFPFHNKLGHRCYNHCFKNKETNG